MPTCSADAFVSGKENVAVFWPDSLNGSGVTPAQATEAVTRAVERSLDTMTGEIEKKQRRIGDQ